MSEQEITFPEFRQHPGDYILCKHCDHDFGGSLECSNCYRDALARFLQFSWWQKHPALEFMGVNVGQALSHQVRGFFMYRWRQQRGDV